MRYFELRPEVAGGLGPASVLDVSSHPPTVTRLNYEFMDWLGDDLLETFPCYVVSDRLAERLLEAQFAGVYFDDVDVTVDREAQDLFTDQGPPNVQWLKISGLAGQDDLGLTTHARLVVSENALKVFQEFDLNHCEIETFESARRGPGAGA